MNLYDVRFVRLTFGLSATKAAELSGISLATIKSFENGDSPVWKKYRQFWIEMCELREHYISQGVEFMPKARFSGDEKSWIARESACGLLLSRHLASKAQKSYNPLFSELNQPMQNTIH